MLVGLRHGSQNVLIIEDVNNFHGFKNHVLFFRLPVSQRFHKKGKRITGLVFEAKSWRDHQPIQKSEVKSLLTYNFCSPPDFWTFASSPSLEHSGLSTSLTSLITGFSLLRFLRHSGYFKQLYSHLPHSVFHLKLQTLTFTLKFLQVIWPAIFFFGVTSILHCTRNKSSLLSQI